MKLSRSRQMAGTFLGAAMIVTACGGPGATSVPTTAATPAPGVTAGPTTAAVTGSIIVSGSSTVEPISTAVSEAFRAANPGFNFTVEGPGTGDGFKRFCNGETDVSDASRPIKQAEADTCAAAGIEYVELKIAYDGLTVMTHPANSAVTCLNFADLYALIGPEAAPTETDPDGFTKWSDASALATGLGSGTVFPDADLVITGPGEESGTYDTFVEFVITPLATAREKENAARPDYQSSPNDNVIIEGIAGNQSSLGWVGFAFAEENLDKVKVVSVSKATDGTCIAPTADTIADGTYPLSRPLFVYINKAKMASNAALVAWVDYYLADGTISTVLKTVPYVNLATSELAATQATWAGVR